MEMLIILDLPTQWLNEILDENVHEVTKKFEDRIDVLLNQTMPEFTRMTVTQTGKDYHSKQAIKQFKNILRSYRKIEDILSENENRQMKDMIYSFTADFFTKITILRNKEIYSDKPKKISVHPEQN